MRLRASTSVVVFVIILVASNPSFPCRVNHPISPEEMVLKADVIVRATAESLIRPASVPNALPPDSAVRFKVEELIRGEMPEDHFDLRGALVESDDFNDHKPPYEFVRPDGRHGSCFATSYRAGAQYVLMLKRSEGHGYTVEWYPLGPVNEQLHSVQDPWLQWVRTQARRLPAQSSK
jgi:hypothetical protein